ncbi:MAG: hypothetical protein AB1Z29_01025 [Desulfobacterales bacterium]
MDYIVVISFVFTATGMNAAAEEVTYEGTIQGLNCTYYTRSVPKTTSIFMPLWKMILFSSYRMGNSFYFQT